MTWVISVAVIAVISIALVISRRKRKRKKKVFGLEVKSPSGEVTYSTNSKSHLFVREHTFTIGTSTSGTFVSVPELSSNLFYAVSFRNPIERVSGGIRAYNWGGQSVQSSILIFKVV